MTLLLDTTVLVDLSRGSSSTNEMLRGFMAAGHLLVTSAVNVGELYAGMRPGEIAKTDDLVSRLECYPVTCAIGHRAGLLASSLARQGRTHAIPDMLVAATALEHGFGIVTGNRKHFDIPGLQLFPLFQ